MVGVYQAKDILDQERRNAEADRAAMTDKQKAYADELIPDVEWAQAHNSSAVPMGTRSSIEARKKTPGAAYQAARGHNLNVAPMNSPFAKQLLLEIAEKYPGTIRGLARKDVGELRDL
jgi:hypothetical protein